MRSERWNDPREIKRFLSCADDPNCAAGPILYSENGTSYVDQSSGHCCFVGNTGKGKSESGSLPLLLTILQKNESAVVSDPKAELYTRCACYIPDHYQTFCLDLRNPESSPTKYNFLSMIHKLFTSSDSKDHTLGSELLAEIAASIYTSNIHEDIFWSSSAANYFLGLVYALLQYGQDDQIHLDSVIRMMDQSDEHFGPSTYLKELYAKLPDNSPAKRSLAVYATAPTETRGSIHSVATNALAPFARSRAMLDLLSHDTLNILDLDVNRPFIVFVILPEETTTYDAIAGMLISQLSQYLIRQAQNLGGSLPIRCNFILEELSTVGKSIPKLDRLMAMCRSRNLRMFLFLQSYSQLDDLYGKSRAQSILSCISTTVAFSSSNWDTLIQLSQRCGERVRERGNAYLKEPLISAVQLAAMPTGTALVLVDNRYKFISHFPRYQTIFDLSDWHAPTFPPDESREEPPTFDLASFVKEQKRKQLMSNIDQPRHPVPPAHPKPIEEFSPLHGIDLDALMRDIDAKIAELDAQEAKQKAGDTADTNSNLIYQVSIVHTGSKRNQVARIVARQRRIKMPRALQMLDDLPITLNFPSAAAAEEIADQLEDAGASLVRSVITEDDL